MKLWSRSLDTWQDVGHIITSFIICNIWWVYSSDLFDACFSPEPGIFLNTSGLQKLSDIIQVHFVWILSCQTASLFGFLDWSHNICVIEIIQQNDRLYYYLLHKE